MKFGSSRAFAHAAKSIIWRPLGVFLLVFGVSACLAAQPKTGMLPENPQAAAQCMFCVPEAHVVAASAGSEGSWSDSYAQTGAADENNGKQEPQKPTEKGGKYSPTANTGSPGHIFWVVPAFKVNYGATFQPLSPHEKFQEWAESVYDPLGLAAGGVEAATLEYSSKDGFCGYGHGWAGYGKCYGSMQLDATDSSFIGDYMLAVLLHQDPRYFRLGKGSAGGRALYSISRVFITYNDSGHNVFYTSGLTGTVVAGVVSNLYYPQQDRGVSPTISRIGLDLANTALYNAAAEFWPDIHGGLHRMFSRKSAASH